MLYKRLPSPSRSFSCLAFSVLSLFLFDAGPKNAAMGQSTAPNRPVARLVSTYETGARGGSLGAGEAPGRQTLAAHVRSREVSSSSIQLSREEKRAYELINAQRAERGLSPLIVDSALTQMARAHSASMSNLSFLNHVGADGLDTSQRARARGIVGWRALGENIAYNQGYPDPEAFAVDKWMNSGKHRANILNGMFTHTGIGIARSSNGTYYFTEVFMAP